LIFTDTDSLCYEVKKTDMYELMKENSYAFDLSDFLTDKQIDDNISKSGCKRKRIHDMNDSSNKKIPGLFKDEKTEFAITEFIGLRSKVNLVLDNSNKHSITLKGIKKSVAENEITPDDYRRCVFDNEDKYVTQNTFQTKLHNIYTVSQKKKALSASDDKVFIMQDGISTRTHGHFRNKLDNAINEAKSETTN